MVKMKRCGLLGKFYILRGQSRLEDWEKKVCDIDCPLDVCIYGRPGPVIKLDAERLEASVIGCPKCQSDPVIRAEIKRGERLSNLRTDEDGWKCWLCSFIIYSHKAKPRKKKEG